MSERGFTLVEILVAVGLFGVVVSIAVGGFVQALRAQRQASAIVAANDNVFLAMEQMAREIRTGRIFCSNRGGSGTAESFACQPSVGGIAFFSGITNETVEYCLSSGAIHRAANGTCGSMNSGPITGSNVFVEYLVFRLSGQDENDGLQPRITVSVGIRPASIGSSFLGPVRIQTTISSRYPDT